MRLSFKSVTILGFMLMRCRITSQSSVEDGSSDESINPQYDLLYSQNPLSHTQQQVCLCKYGSVVDAEGNGNGCQRDTEFTMFPWQCLP